MKEYVLLEENKVWGGNGSFGSTKEKPVMIHNIMVMMMLRFINIFHNKSWFGHGASKLLPKSQGVVTTWQVGLFQEKQVLEWTAQN